MAKYNITLFTGSLGGGGAERSLTVLAEAFSTTGHKVHVLTYMPPEDDFHTLPDAIPHTHIDLGKTRSVRWFDIIGNIRRFKKIRKAIQSTKPDIVISFLDGPNELFLLSSIGKKYLKILSCQVDMRRHAHYNARWVLLRKYLFRFADKIVFLDKEQATWAAKEFKGWNTDGIPNPIPDVAATVAKNSSVDFKSPFKHTIAAMGRLADQKGFDMLIDSFAKIANQHPDWGIVILGEGPLREDLEALRNKAELKERILMPGRLTNPFPFLQSCDIFAFSSRYEGQGLALAEAMACGLPAVSFDCPSGPSTIIRPDIDGILVPEKDVNGFSNALESLMKDDPRRSAMAQRAVEAQKRFSSDTILPEWHTLFSELVKIQT